MSPHLDFNTLSERKLLGSSDGYILSWCPTMDLLAFSMMNRTSLWVYRMSGQRVYSVNNRCQILQIIWKPDGKSFGLVGSDGNLKIYDSNSGKLINIIMSDKNSISERKTVLANWCHKEANLLYNGQTNEIWEYDVFKSLPKLSPLANPTPENIFTTKLAVDGISDNNSQMVDFLVCASDSNSLSFTLYGNFTINGIPLNELDPARFVGHCATTDLTTHYFVAESGQNAILLKAKANFIPNYSKHLIDVARSSSKVLALLGYFKESVIYLTEETRAFNETLTNLHTTFREDIVPADAMGVLGDKMIVNSLYDLLLTGMMSEELRKILETSVGERGFKKLSKMGNVAYENTRKICYYQLITPIERFVTILSKLKGIALWIDNVTVYGLDSVQIQKAIDSAGETLRYIYNIIWKINEEQKLFNIFHEWISIQIDMISDEDFKGEFNGKIGDILKYLDSHLLDSFIYQFLKYDGKINNSGTYLLDLQEKVAEESDKIFNRIDESMRKMVEVENPIVITASGFKEVKTQIIGEFGYILFNFETHIELIQFNIHSEQTRKVKMIYNEMSFLQVDFMESKEMVVLLQNEERSIFLTLSYLDLNYELENINLEELSFVSRKRVFENINFVPGKFAISGNPNKRVGCLLATNKQNYVLFEIDKPKVVSSEDHMEE